VGADRGVRDEATGGPGRGPRSVPGRYRRTVLLAVVEVVVLLVVLGLLLSRLGVLSAAPRERGPVPVRASWAPAHDEVDGATRVLLRRSYAGPDGLPVALEDRVLTTFPADDPAWELRFTEAMANARYRCGYLNAEEEH
jgi:hypothetical protein